MYDRIYLNVPYVQKEEAKALGAKWDGDVKKWYYEGDVKNFPKFGKWLFDKYNDEGAVIVYDCITIIEAPRICHRCKKETRVVGFGVGMASWIEYDCEDEDKEGTYVITDPEEILNGHDQMYIAWTDDESKVPPLILKYLKEHYNIKTGYSKIAGKCFANHCDHCGALQGNNYVYEEVDCPFSTGKDNFKEMRQRVQRMKFYNVYLDTPLVLPWYVKGSGYVPWAYEYFGRGRFVDLGFEGCDDMYITYKEMYNL